MNEQEYFAEQSRKRLADLGIEPGPREPLEEKDAEIARLRLGITLARGIIIGSLAGGHLDGEYGAEYGKNALHQIADALGIDIPERKA